MLHVLPLSVAADGVFTLTDRTEARARYPDPILQNAGNDSVALDIDTLMDARAIWTGRHVVYTVADLPRFTLLDYNGAAISPAVLDSVVLAAEWHWPRVQFRVNENASYGELSMESLSALPTLGTPQPSPGAPGQPTPAPTATLVPNTSSPILFASSDSSIGSTLLLRNWAVLPRVGYLLTGGVNDAAQAILPFQKGPYAELTADYKLRARDHLVTVATASQTSFTPLGTDDLLADIEEQWRHQWSRRTETMLSGGWYAARTRANADASDQFVDGPIAEGALDEHVTRGAHVTDLRFDVRLAPFINRLTGLVDEQIRGTAEASWTHRRVKLRAFASAAESTQQGTVTSARYGTAEVDAAYKLNEVWSFDGGLRALYQEQNGLPIAGGTQPTVESLTQGVLFFAVTVRPVKERF